MVVLIHLKMQYYLCRRQISLANWDNHPHFLNQSIGFVQFFLILAHCQPATHIP
ncbi:hypothetical protein [Salinibacter phage M8CR30-4]|uniref:Uncharacterized protein n=2 Tax=Holosalinivirus M8CR302 TaxID=2041855 RepID=A0A2I6UGL5_9CAUD|nr:hypothetical protein FGG64_gp07 [Salinibacter phage M8CR30-2]AUO79066.1 hypothetical protein [Salinibacter phage M8CR30-2]AUO79107.1 hypothetical protein [Salinibacter phage M8CR30-4]